MASLTFFYLLYVVTQVLTSVWLSKWSDDPILNGTEGRQQTSIRLGVYGGFGAIQGKLLSIDIEYIGVNQVLTL